MWFYFYELSAAAAKSLHSCPPLCDPIGSSPPGSPVPGILQARTLEWVAISFSNAWKWKVKVKSLSPVWLLATPWMQPTRLLRPWDSPGKSAGVGCQCLLCYEVFRVVKFIETEKRMVVAKDWGKGGMGNYCLMGIEFWFCKMRRFWRLATEHCEYT